MARGREFVVCRDGRVIPVPSGVLVHDRPVTEPLGVLWLAAALVTEPMAGVVIVHVSPGAERAAIVVRYLGGLPGRVRARVVVKPPQNVLAEFEVAGLEELSDIYDASLILPVVEVLRGSARAVAVDGDGREVGWDDAVAVRLLTRVQAAERASVIEARQMVASGRDRSMQRWRDWSTLAAGIRDRLHVLPATSGAAEAATVPHAFGAYLARYAVAEAASWGVPETVAQLGQLVGGTFEPPPSQDLMGVQLLVAGTAVLVSYRQPGSGPDGLVWLFAGADGRVELDPQADDVIAAGQGDIRAWIGAVLADPSTRVLALDAAGAGAAVAAIIPVADSQANTADLQVEATVPKSVAAQAWPQPVWATAPLGTEVIVRMVSTDPVMPDPQDLVRSGAGTPQLSGRSVADVLGWVAGADEVGVLRLVEGLRKLVVRWEGQLQDGVGLGRLPLEWNRFVVAVIEAGQVLSSVGRRAAVVGAVGAYDFAVVAVGELVPWLRLPRVDEVVAAALQDEGVLVGGWSNDLQVGVVHVDGMQLDEDELEFYLAGRSESERVLLAGLAADPQVHTVPSRWAGGAVATQPVNTLGLDPEGVEAGQVEVHAASAWTQPGRFSLVIYGKYWEWKTDHDAYLADPQNLLEPVATVSVIGEWVQQKYELARKPTAQALHQSRLNDFLENHDIAVDAYTLAREKRLNKAGKPHGNKITGVVREVGRPHGSWGAGGQSSVVGEKRGIDATGPDAQSVPAAKKAAPARKEAGTGELDAFDAWLKARSPALGSAEAVAGAVRELDSPEEVSLKVVSQALPRLMNHAGGIGRLQRFPSELKNDDVWAFLWDVGLDPDAATIVQGPKLRNVARIVLSRLNFRPSGKRLYPFPGGRTQWVDPSPVKYRMYGHWKEDHDAYLADPQNRLEPVATVSVIREWVQQNEKLAKRAPSKAIVVTRLEAFLEDHDVAVDAYTLNGEEGLTKAGERNGRKVAGVVREVGRPHGFWRAGGQSSVAGEKRGIDATEPDAQSVPAPKKAAPARKSADTAELDAFDAWLNAWRPVPGSAAAGVVRELDSPVVVSLKVVSQALPRVRNRAGGIGRSQRPPSALRGDDVRAFLRGVGLDPAGAEMEIGNRGYLARIVLKKLVFLSSRVGETAVGQIAQDAGEDRAVEGGGEAAWEDWLLEEPGGVEGRGQAGDAADAADDWDLYAEPLLPRDFGVGSSVPGLTAGMGGLTFDQRDRPQEWDSSMDLRWDPGFLSGWVGEVAGSAGPGDSFVGGVGDPLVVPDTAGGVVQEGSVGGGSQGAGSQAVGGVDSDDQDVFLVDLPGAGRSVADVLGWVAGADEVGVLRLVEGLRKLVVRWEGQLQDGVGLGWLPLEWNRFVVAVIEAGQVLSSVGRRAAVVGAVGAYDFAVVAVGELVPWLRLPGVDEVVAAALHEGVSAGSWSNDLQVGVVHVDGRQLEKDELEFYLAGRSEQERVLLAGLAEHPEVHHLPSMSAGTASAQSQPRRHSPVIYRKYWEWKTDHDAYLADPQNLLEPVATVPVIGDWVQQNEKLARKPNLQRLSQPRLNAFLKNHDIAVDAYTFDREKKGLTEDGKSKGTKVTGLVRTVHPHGYWHGDGQSPVADEQHGINPTVLDAQSVPAPKKAAPARKKTATARKKAAPARKNSGTGELDAFDAWLDELRPASGSAGAGTVRELVPRLVVDLNAVSQALARLRNQAGGIGRLQRTPSELKNDDVWAFLWDVGLDPDAATIVLNPTSKSVARIVLSELRFRPSGERLAPFPGGQTQWVDPSPVKYLMYWHWKTDHEAYLADPQNRLEPVATTTVISEWVQQVEGLANKPPTKAIHTARLNAFLESHDIAVDAYTLTTEKAFTKAGKPGGSKFTGVVREGGRPHGSWRDGGRSPVAGDKRGIEATEPDAESFSAPKKAARTRKNAGTGELDAFLAWLKERRPAPGSAETGTGTVKELDSPEEVSLKAVSQALPRLRNQAGGIGRPQRPPSRLRSDDVRAFLWSVGLDPAGAEIEITEQHIVRIVLRELRFLPSGVGETAVGQIAQDAGEGRSVGGGQEVTWEDWLLEEPGGVGGLAQAGDAADANWDLYEDPFRPGEAGAGSSVPGLTAGIGGLTFDQRDQPQGQDLGLDLGWDQDFSSGWVGEVGGIGGLGGSFEGGVGDVDSDDQDVFLVDLPGGVPGSVASVSSVLRGMSEQQLRELAGDVVAELAVVRGAVVSRLGDGVGGKGLWGSFDGGVLDRLSGASVDSLRGQVSQMLAGYDFARVRVSEIAGWEVDSPELEGLLPSVDVLVAGLLTAKQPLVDRPVVERPVAHPVVQRLVSRPGLVSAPRGADWVGRVLPLGVVSERRVAQVARWAEGMVRPVVVVGTVESEADGERLARDVGWVMRWFGYAGVRPVVQVLDTSSVGDVLEGFRPVVIERITVGMGDRWAVYGADGVVVQTVEVLTEDVFARADELAGVSHEGELPAVLFEWLLLFDPVLIERYVSEHLGELMSPEVSERLGQVPFEDAGVHRTVLNLMHRGVARQGGRVASVRARFVPVPTGNHSEVAALAVDGAVPETFVFDYLAPQDTLDKRKAWNDQLVQLVDVRSPQEVARTGVWGLGVQEMLALAANTRDEVPGLLDARLSRAHATVFTGLAQVLRMSQDTVASLSLTGREWSDLITPLVACDLSPAARKIVIHQFDRVRDRLRAVGRGDHAALVELITYSLAECT